ncbi:MAG TPA: hypothetical protein VGO62_06455, partial [Myxococcota bacterium]
DVAVACEHLDQIGVGARKLALGDALTVPVDARGRVSMVALADAAWGEARRLAAAYDKRNGNAWFSRALEQKRALLAFAVDAPLVRRLTLT